MSGNTELARFQGNTDLAARQDRVGQGSESVTARDMAIPRLKLLQQMNEEVMHGNAKYIEGARAGLILNSVSRELHTALFVINLNFAHKVVVWRKRSAGSGMFGTFDDEIQARAALADAGEDEGNYDITDNPEHLVLILSDTGEPKGYALLDMPGTKAKVSRQWNTLIHEQEQIGNPRFGCVWQLGVQSESNNKGNYYNFDVKLVVQAPDEIYKAAEAARDSFFGRQAVEEEAAA